jgi:lysyl-tRNA synthetase class 2
VIEIDTPVLSHTTVTDPAIESFVVTAGGSTLYLQTSPEFHLKRMLAAGVPSVVRIGPVFRAEESGRIHNPEFTMVEWYRLGFDLEQLMDETAALVDLLLGPATYQRIDYGALIAGKGVDAFEDTNDVLITAARRTGASDSVESWSRRELLDLIAAAALRERTGRWFVTGYPPAQAALARLVTDEHGRTVAARFELVVDGIELANGYDELLDADVLAARMAADRDTRRLQGRPTYAADERLLAALRAGLPACSGVALGFDRLFMLARGEAALDAVLPFSGARA